MTSKIRQYGFRALASAGISEHDVYLAKSIKHSRWLWSVFLRNNRSIPVQRLRYSETSPVTEEDVALCERLLRAYHLDRKEGLPPLSPMWKDLANKRIRLSDCLDNNNPRDLAQLLSTMLRSSVVHGIETGDLYNEKNWRIHSLKLLDDLVSLAEYVGVARTESGAGTTAHAFDNGLPALVHDIEGQVGFDIGAPQVAGAYGIFIDGRLITQQATEYVYVATRIRDALKAARGSVLPSDRKLKIVEIGAGYGATAHFVMKIDAEDVSQYTIIDLSAVNVLQGYYLSKAWGPDAVRLNGEPDTEHTKFHILPTTALGRVGTADVLVNENSMPEFPAEACRTYLAWARESVRLFYSYNHETLTSGREFAVVTVPEAVAEAGGFRRVSRNASWLRPGFVEDIYVTLNPPRS